MSTRLILVRHGETPASVDRRFAGSTDVELTDHGHEQTRALARRLRPVRIDALYVSPLIRCRQTASAIEDTTGLKPRLVEDLRECRFGEWENLTLTEVVQRDAELFQTWIADDGVAPVGGESWREVWARVESWWKEASERHRDRTILAVTHGGPILSFLRHAVGGPYHSMFVFEIDPGSVTLLQTRGELLRLRVANDTSHLRDVLRDGPPPEEVPP